MNNNYADLLINADIDEVFAVNNKDIEAPVKYTDVVVKGDNNSNSLIFKMNKVMNGEELSEKNFEIFYTNADGHSDIVSASSVLESDDYILFSWLLGSDVTHSAGTVTFIIRVTGDNYIWKSKPSSFEVVETMNVEVNEADYPLSWSAGIEERLAALERNTLTEITEEEIEDIFGGEE